jgi:2-hydroxychromene-2-carboxylate isomerase
MVERVDIYFNFRSPYGYLATKILWPICEDYHSCLVWRPLGGWDG